jgi:integrase
VPREPDAPMLSHIRRLREHFGEMRAIAVTTRCMDDYIALLNAQRRANASINRSTQLLAQAFRLAAAADPPKVLRPLKVPKLDESDNVRKGKFTEAEAELVFSSLPPYMVDVARFGYETGCRSGEIKELLWQYVEPTAIRVPGKLTKNRSPHLIALTARIEAILERRQAARIAGCDLIFHRNGKPVGDYRKCWHSACLVNGLAQWHCRDCRDDEGNYISPLDAAGECPKCGRRWKDKTKAKYVGRRFHDFRRSASHEMLVGGSTIEDCMKATGHKTPSMFKRYADIFSEEEVLEIQREVQRKREIARAKALASVPDQPMTARVQ